MNDEEPVSSSPPTSPRLKFSLRSLLIGTLLSGALVHANFTFPPVQVIVIDMLALAALAMWIAWKTRNHPAANDALGSDRQYLAEFAIWLPILVVFVVLRLVLKF